MLKKKISILDYGLGNQSSIKASLQRLGYPNVIITKNKKILENSELLILPGVGNFEKAITNLKKDDLIKFLKKLIKEGLPTLGICLGLQILFSKSEEAFASKGLNLIKGNILKLNKKNIGWHQIKTKKKNSLFSFLNNQFFYFNNSYALEASNKYTHSTSFNYEKIPVIIKSKNVIGVQFHPEKSQFSGDFFLKKILTNNYFYK
jgi:glutamine amidotransferase